MNTARDEVTAVMHLPELESGQSWCCSKGCGTCTPVSSFYEYSRHEDLHGRLIESKSHIVWVSSCCSADLMLWDERKQDFVDGWEKMEPAGDHAATAPSTPATTSETPVASPPMAKVIPLVVRPRPHHRESLKDRILARVPGMRSLPQRLHFPLFLLLAGAALAVLAWLLATSAVPHRAAAGPFVASPVTGVRWHAAAGSVVGQGTTTIDTHAGAVEVVGLVSVEPGATATLRSVQTGSGQARQLCVATAARTVCHPVMR